MENVDYKIGHIVRLKQPCLGNPTGALGVCYEEYRLDGRWGASFIFENGEYDGFSEEDAASILTKAGFTPHVAKYRFTNVIQLSHDFAAGRFASALSDKPPLEPLTRSK